MGFLYLAFTRMSGESYRSRLRSWLLYVWEVFRALINSPVSWFWRSALSLVLFPVCDDNVLLLLLCLFVCLFFVCFHDRINVGLWSTCYWFVTIMCNCVFAYLFSSKIHDRINVGLWSTCYWFVTIMCNCVFAFFFLKNPRPNQCGLVVDVLLICDDNV